MDFSIQDHVIVLFLLQGLTPDWHSVKSRYLDRSERKVSFQDMKNHILQGIPDPPRASKPTTPGRARFSGTCHHCQKTGHKERLCWLRYSLHQEVWPQFQEARGLRRLPSMETTHGAFLEGSTSMESCHRPSTTTRRVTVWIPTSGTDIRCITTKEAAS
jgi:hypothetical protein